MIQIKIVKYLGILTIIIGAIMNLLQIDIWASLTFMGIVGLSVFLAINNLYCLLHGSCVFSATLAAITFSFVLLGISHFYIGFLIRGGKVPSLANQPIVALNPIIHKSGELAQKYININIYELDDKFRSIV